MIRLALYVGIGLLLHLMLIGSHVDPSSIWTWIVILAWPLAWLAFLGSLIGIVLGCGLLGLAIFIFVAWSKQKWRIKAAMRREKRRMAGLKS
jgi:hypothetical protein